MTLVYIYGDDAAVEAAKDAVAEALDNREQREKNRKRAYDKKREDKRRLRELYYLRHRRDYEIMGVLPGTSKADIKKAYKVSECRGIGRRIPGRAWAKRGIVCARGPMNSQAGMIRFPPACYTYLEPMPLTWFIHFVPPLQALAMKWHPDKHAMDPEKLVIAKAKFQDIQRAFDTLMTTDEDERIEQLAG